MRRERNEKIAFAGFLAKIVSIFVGKNLPEIPRFLEEYSEEVLQLKYNSKYQTVYHRELVARLKKYSADMQVLDKVNQLTVRD